MISRIEYFKEESYNSLFSFYSKEGDTYITKDQKILIIGKKDIIFVINTLKISLEPSIDYKFTDVRKIDLHISVKRPL